MGTWEHLSISNESHFVYFLILDYYDSMTSINDLQNDPKNARKRTDRSAKLIKQSLEQYGAARSIVIDENNRILAGNGTIAGAKAAGIKNLKIVEANGDEIIAVKRTGLSEEEKVGLAIADNRTGDLSEWDIDMLDQLSKEHDLNDFFDKKELDDILSKKEVIPTEGLTDPDDVPEVPEEPITKEGDLYILGNHRLLCGDSTNIQHVEKLMDDKKADMVFTDIPYNISQKSNGLRKLDYGEWDKNVPEIGVEVQAHNLGESQYYFCGDEQLSGILKSMKNNKMSTRTFVWKKTNPTVMNGEKLWLPSQELCAYGKKPKAIFNGHCVHAFWEGCPDTARVHPNQKPIKMIEICINASSNKNNVVLDYFGGSGSTLIAAERLKRHAYLMELDPKYCDVIVKRWEDFTGNKAKRVSSS